MRNGLACHVVVSMCLLVSNLNVYANPEGLRPSRDTTGILIQLLKVKINEHQRGLFFKSTDTPVPLRNHVNHLKI